MDFGATEVGYYVTKRSQKYKLKVFFIVILWPNLDEVTY